MDPRCFFWVGFLCLFFGNCAPDPRWDENLPVESNSASNPPYRSVHPTAELPVEAQPNASAVQTGASQVASGMTAEERSVQPEKFYTGYKMSPYKVKGKRYVPMSVEQAVSHTEYGLASFYKHRDGAPLANGEKYYAKKRTAAHTTLPIPSVIRVTNLENGRSVVVRVNDRGPFIKGRIIDVSDIVADELDMKKQGLVQCKIEVISVGDGIYRRTASGR